MTAPFVTPPSSPHDRVIDGMRHAGPGQTPADASAVRPRTPEATWGEMGRQFTRGLGESGLQTVEGIAAFSDFMTGRGALPEPMSAVGMVRKAFANTRQQMTETYGEPTTDEGKLAGMAGNVVGSSAIGAAAEGVLGPIRSMLAARRVARAKYRLVPRDAYNDSFMIQKSNGVPEGTLHGDYSPEDNVFYVDYVGSYKGQEAGANTLGHKATRDILRQLQDVYPDLKYLVSDARITGMRGRAYVEALKKGSAPPSLAVRVPVPPRRELMPTLRRLGDKLRKKLGQADRPPAPFEGDVIRAANDLTPNSPAANADQMIEMMYLNPQHLRDIMP